MAFSCNMADAMKLLGNAAQAVSTVTEQIQQAKETGTVLTSADEAGLEQKIAELEALLPGLRASTQAKLRGGPQ